MSWILDKGHSKVSFSIKHMMFSTVRGTFSEFECDPSLKAEDLTNSSVSAKIGVRSISTGDRTRDEFLLSKDFFRPDEFPFVTFQSTRVQSRGSQISLVGTLKIRDQERSVTLEGSFKGPKQGFGGKKRMSFSLDTQIQRDSFGLNFNSTLETGKLLVGNALSIRIEVDLIEE